MSNSKNITLDEIRINSVFLEDALSAVLQTILFVRSSAPVKPKDHACQALSPLVFAKCGSKEVDQSVETSIEAFKQSLIPQGMCMKGEVLLSFFDKREVKEYLGLFTRFENVCFEKWNITLVVLDANLGDGIASANTSVDKAEAYRSAYDQITNTIMSIIVAANTGTDHIPPTQYEYEIFVNTLLPCSGGSSKSSGGGGGGGNICHHPTHSSISTGGVNQQQAGYNNSGDNYMGGGQEDRRRRSTGSRPLNPNEITQKTYR